MLAESMGVVALRVSFARGLRDRGYGSVQAIVCAESRRVEPRAENPA